MEVFGLEFPPTSEPVTNEESHASMTQSFKNQEVCDIFPETEF